MFMPCLDVESSVYVARDYRSSSFQHHGLLMSKCFECSLKPSFTSCIVSKYLEKTSQMQNYILHLGLGGQQKKPLDTLCKEAISHIWDTDDREIDFRVQMQNTPSGHNCCIRHQLVGQDRLKLCRKESVFKQLNIRQTQGEKATANLKDIWGELERHFGNSAALTQALIERLSQAANFADKDNAIMQKLADLCADVDYQMIHLRQTWAGTTLSQTNWQQYPATRTLWSSSGSSGRRHDHKGNRHGDI